MGETTMLYLNNKTCQDILFDRLDTYFSNCKLLNMAPKSLVSVMWAFNTELFDDTMSIADITAAAKAYRDRFVGYVI